MARVIRGNTPTTSYIFYSLRPYFIDSLCFYILFLVIESDVIKRWEMLI